MRTPTDGSPPRTDARTATRTDARTATRADARTATRIAGFLTRLTGDEKHAASAHSTLDVLRVLYERVLRIDPAHPGAPARDRFVLSKGHGPAAYYAVLAERGFIPESWLDDLAGPSSALGHHPDRVLVPGIEIGSGSLGHGLGLGVGIALALRATPPGPARPTPGRSPDGRPPDDRSPDGWPQDGWPQDDGPPRVYVLLGDAELDEGSNHEAIAFAGAIGLGALTAVVIDNDSATHGRAGGLAPCFAVHGWTTRTTDGHDHDAIEAALRSREPGRPHVVVARVERKGS